jgi:hypothetical protein
MKCPYKEVAFPAKFMARPEEFTKEGLSCKIPWHASRL